MEIVEPIDTSPSISIVSSFFILKPDLEGVTSNSLNDPLKLEPAFTGDKNLTLSKP